MEKINEKEAENKKFNRKRELEMKSEIIDCIETDEMEKNCLQQLARLPTKCQRDLSWLKNLRKNSKD